MQEVKWVNFGFFYLLSILATKGMATVDSKGRAHILITESVLYRSIVSGFPYTIFFDSIHFMQFS
jgi:hypothetical protein